MATATPRVLSEAPHRDDAANETVPAIGKLVERTAPGDGEAKRDRRAERIADLLSRLENTRRTVLENEATIVDLRAELDTARDTGRAHEILLREARAVLRIQMAEIAELETETDTLTTALAARTADVARLDAGRRRDETDIVTLRAVNRDMNAIAAMLREDRDRLRADAERRDRDIDGLRIEQDRLRGQTAAQAETLAAMTRAAGRPLARLSRWLSRDGD